MCERSLCSWDNRTCRDKSDSTTWGRGGLQGWGLYKCIEEGSIGEIVLESMDSTHYGWRSRSPSSRAVMIAIKLVAVSGS
jgi:hypothetical protein